MTREVHNVLTPIGIAVDEYETYYGFFLDATQKKSREEVAQICAKWLQACPSFWLKQFQEDMELMIEMKARAWAFPKAFGAEEN